MGNNQDIVRTGVDDLLDLLKYSPKMPLADAAKKLNVSVDIIQAWVDFLVEESIVGIEYSFTTPYIYLNKPLETPAGMKIDDKGNLMGFKREFWDKARGNNVPENSIPLLWKNHLVQALELKKKFFMFEAQKRRVPNAEKAWEEYNAQLLSE